MSIKQMGSWATDFNIEDIRLPKPSNTERFINYCKSQNIGVLALALCVDSNQEECGRC